MIHNKFRYILTLVALLAVTTGAWATDPDLENDYTLVKSVTWGDGVNIAGSGACAYTAYDTGTKKQMSLTILTAPEAAAGWIAMQAWTDGSGKGWWNRADNSLYCVNAGRSACVFGDDLTTGWLVVFECKNTASSAMTLTNANSEPDGTFTYVASEDGKKYFCTITAAQNAYVGFCGIKNVQGITKISVYKPNAAAAPSGPEVAWNKTTKTGTFTMPGGNVTVSVEYYDLATLAFQGLTAAEDAAAKTEAPLAVLAENAVTGGTLMYYLAPNGDFSQADAIALAETEWSADIPTAETIDAAGTYYVWYYIKGDDEHSDTDPKPLAVTVLPEPTYTVEFAEGTEESDKWKAEPNADVKKGETVTVTYTGAKKVIGVKAEKKAKTAAEKTIKIDGQDYTVLNGETWKQFITRNQLSTWYLDQMTLYTWGVCIDDPYSKLHVSSDGTNWTQLVLSSQDAPIDTDKQYKWVQEEIGGGEPPF